MIKVEFSTINSPKSKIKFRDLVEEFQIKDNIAGLFKIEAQISKQKCKDQNGFSVNTDFIRRVLT